MRFRLGLVYFGIVLFLGFICFRLVQLQVLGNEQLRKLASRQYDSAHRRETPQRAAILDRNGKELAVSMRAASIFAHPKAIKNKAYAASVLSSSLGGTPLYWKKVLASKKPFIWIRRQVSDQKGKQIAQKKLAGIYVRGENTRVYPNGSLAAQVLGFTDIDGKGISGVEFSQNRELLYSPNEPLIQRDGKGQTSYIGEKLKYWDPENPEQTGLHLTIDTTVQYMVEEELKQALTRTKAKGAMALVMDPYTGEVLAMGQQPSFDPNHAAQSSSSHFVNRFISHRYEPGSTLKAILTASALERGLLKPDSVLDGHMGRYKIGNKVFREAEAKHQFKTLTVAEVIRYSSNIGAIEIAHKLGAKGVRSALDNFGLADKTNIGLSGEIVGSLRSQSKWTPIVLANISFGQGVAFTPLQMVAAFAPLANGGYYVRPKILMREVSAVNRDNLDIRRVISPRTAQQMKEILVSVTESEKGSGRAARVPGIRVGGKTGTAQKYAHGQGYTGGRYYSSFIGFLPAEQPQLLIGVVIDEPQGTYYYGSQIAAPVFQKIAQKALQILDRSPKQMAKSPPYVEQRFSAPAVPPKVDKSDGKWVMPTLQGLSVREALKVLGKDFSNLELSGHGFLVAQNPKPGAAIHSRAPIQLEFAPRE